MADSFPTESALFPEITHYGYFDSFAAPLQRTDVEAWELIAAFFQSAPRWVNILLALRNRVVRIFGLKTGPSKPSDLNPPYEVGRSIGSFRVFGITDSEAIFGQDDSHLDFRISLLLVHSDAGDHLVVSTLVKTKNALGVVYFSVVKHFHRFIVPIMVRTMARKLDERPQP